MPEAVPNHNEQNLCMSCGLSIQDQYIYKVTPDLKWHESCLKCVECSLPLKENSTCFIKNGKPYCKTDYLNKFIMKCDRCNFAIKRNELFMKSKQKVYHYDCFLCTVCNRKLQPGDEYLIKDDLLYCKEDALVVLNNNNNNNNNNSSSSTSQQLYLPMPNNHNSYHSSTMAITPETSASFSPSTSSSSSSSSIVDSPSYANNSSYLMSNNYLFNSTNGSSCNNSYSNLNKISNFENKLGHQNGDQEDDNSVSDNESDDLNDNSDDDEDLDEDLNSMQSDDCSLNESANSFGNKHFNKKKNNKLGSANKKAQQQGNNGASLLQIHGFNHHQSHHHHSQTPTNTSGSSTKPARIRTVLNEKQLHTLRACYGANPRPDALMKEQLVELTGLNPRVIRVWFQNKRCKDKKKNMGLVRPEHSLPQLAQYHQSLATNTPPQNQQPTNFNNQIPIHQSYNNSNQSNFMYENCI